VFPQTSLFLEPLCKRASDLSVKPSTPTSEWIPKLWPAFVMRNASTKFKLPSPSSRPPTIQPRDKSTPHRTPHTALPQTHNPLESNHSQQSLHAPRPLATMPSERDYQISPLVQESIIHNTRVRYHPPLPSHQRHTQLTSACATDSLQPPEHLRLPLRRRRRHPRS
jgi:hypothetical protein